MEDPIASSYTHFLKRDPLYDHEKPYSLRFTAPEGFRRANILLEKHAIRVRDIRDSRQQPSLEKDGCALLNFHSTMRYSDFDSEIRIKDTYLKEVANTLKTLLQAQHVQIFEHTVCYPPILYNNRKSLHIAGSQTPSDIPDLNRSTISIQSAYQHSTRRHDDTLGSCHGSAAQSYSRRSDCQASSAMHQLLEAAQGTSARLAASLVLSIKHQVSFIAT